MNLNQQNMPFNKNNLIIGVGGAGALLISSLFVQTITLSLPAYRGNISPH
jgi:hypothetical protein